MKKKLSIQEQVKHMESKGILFGLSGKNDAELLLSNGIYYFKIKAYAKNFPKNDAGAYINLEFAYLHELALLDLQLRQIILNMSINIEHALKVAINSHFSSNDLEDGYSIIESFKEHYKQENHREISINKNLYTEDLYDKYSACPAVWNFMEMIPFGDLIEFYKYYFKVYDQDLFKISHLLFSVRRLRNASAHSNCLLINLTKNQLKKDKITYEVRNILTQKGLSTEEIKNKLAVIVLHDFTALLCCFKKIVKSEAIMQNTFDNLNNVVNRINLNIFYFDKHKKLKENLRFFEKAVDFFK